MPQLEAGLLTQFMQTDGKRLFAMSAEAYQQLARLDRHHAALQKTFDRAMKELRDLQQEEDLSTDSADYAEVQNEPTGVEVPQEVLLTRPGS